jgi:hypothetical protein
MMNATSSCCLHHPSSSLPGKIGCHLGEFASYSCTCYLLLDSTAWERYCCRGCASTAHKLTLPVSLPLNSAAPMLQTHRSYLNLISRPASQVQTHCWHSWGTSFQIRHPNRASTQPQLTLHKLGCVRHSTDTATAHMISTSVCSLPLSMQRHCSSSAQVAASACSSWSHQTAMSPVASCCTHRLSRSPAHCGPLQQQQRQARKVQRWPACPTTPA